MGIDEIGSQGQEFDKKVLENIKSLKNNLPGIIISVDGGVNLENAESILDGRSRPVNGRLRHLEKWRPDRRAQKFPKFDDMIYHRNFP